MMLRRFLLPLVLCLFVSSAAPVTAQVAAGAVAASRGSSKVRDDPQPHWPRAFRSDFNETTKIFFWSWNTSGRIAYDADQGAELVYRDNGRGDRYCGSVQPLTDTPCTHLVVGGNRYLIFPELGKCCLCCTAASGCGILDPDWLQGAEYVGQVTMQGQLANEWAIRGLQPNQYYATADDREVPLELDQDPNDYITFHPNTFKPGRVPPSVFAQPAMDCSQSCPLASLCTIAALDTSLRSWLGAATRTPRAGRHSLRAQLARPRQVAAQ